MKQGSELSSPRRSQETLRGGVWQAVSSRRLRAHSTLQICMRLKGGLEHQSLFEAPLDAAQRDRWSETMRTAWLWTTVPRMHRASENKSGTHQCHDGNNKPWWCASMKLEQRFPSNILPLRQLRYFCISADFSAISVNSRDGRPWQPGRRLWIKYDGLN